MNDNQLIARKCPICDADLKIEHSHGPLSASGKWTDAECPNGCYTVDGIAQKEVIHTADGNTVELGPHGGRIVKRINENEIRRIISREREFKGAMPVRIQQRAGDQHINVTGHYDDPFIQKMLKAGWVGVREGNVMRFTGINELAVYVEPTEVHVPLTTVEKVHGGGGWTIVAESMATKNALKIRRPEDT